MRHYQVRDVMTANPMTVTPATPLKNVAAFLVRGRIGVVPVLTPQGRVAGVVAEGDLLRKEQLQRDPEGRHSMHLPYRIRRDEFRGCRDLWLFRYPTVRLSFASWMVHED